MRKVHDERLRMFAATAEVLRKHQNEFATLPALINAYQQLREQVRTLFQLKEKQELNRTGFAADKRIKRSAMADMAMQVCGKVKAYACNNQDDVLLGKVNIAVSSMMSGKSTTALTLAKSIYHVAELLPAIAKTEFGITTDLMQQLESALQDYNACISAPRIAQVQCTTQTRQIDQLVQSTSSLLRNEIDGLMRVYQAQDFFGDYIHARRISKTATNQASIIGKVTVDNGTPVSEATVELSNSSESFEDITDNKGKYKLRNLKAEIYNLKVTFPGYKEYILTDVGLYAGEHERIDVKLARDEVMK